MHIPEDEAERRRLNERGREILRRKNGAVRPHREDGYVNLLNKYGTKQDNSEAYKFEREPVIPDMQLTGLYSFALVLWRVAADAFARLSVL